MDALASDKTRATPPCSGEAQPTGHEPVRLNGYMDVTAGNRTPPPPQRRPRGRVVGWVACNFPKTHVGPAFQPVKTG